MRWSATSTGPTSPCAVSCWTPGGRGRGAAGYRHRPRHRSDRRWALPQLRGDRPRSGHLHHRPEARHGHKTAAHGFDGYKAHLAVDPDSEIICAAEVSAATAGDAAVAATLLGEFTSDHESGGHAARAVIYGDSAYGTGAHLAWLDQQQLTPMVKAQLQPHRETGPPKTSSVSTWPQARSPARRGHHPDPARLPRRGPGSVRCCVQRLPAAGRLHSSVRGRVVASTGTRPS
jgi:DDE family transposase